MRLICIHLYVHVLMNASVYVIQVKEIISWMLTSDECHEYLLENNPSKYAAIEAKARDQKESWNPMSRNGYLLSDQEILPIWKRYQQNCE